MASPADDRLVVAAIDFGTTFSGYAFSFRNEYKDDPMKICSNQNWYAGTAGLVSLKTPTCILLKPDKTFDSFGFAAENIYNDLGMDNEHHDYFFFRQFKMKLYKCKELNKDTNMEDETGKMMAALTVISLSIRFMKDHLLNALKNRVTIVDEKDVHWVITVPAIWDETAKHFMRDATIEAGIPGDQVSVALEPEAASLYCQHLPIQRIVGDSGAAIGVSRPGHKYLVADLGGGTVDITVHEKQEDGTLRELSKASGGEWGGTAVDRAYLKLLADVTSENVIARFKKEYFLDLLDLFRDFEVKKRTIGTESAQSVTVKLPGSLCRLYLEENNAKLNESLRADALGGKVRWIRDKIKVDMDIMKGLFKPTVDAITQHISSILLPENMKSVDTILMVGGFSECQLLQDEIRQQFPDKKVIIPAEAGLAVLRGAVLFGYAPSTIKSRVSRYTYGTRIAPMFKEGQHPETKRIIRQGSFRCKDIFSKYIEIDQTLDIGQCVTKTSVPLSDKQDRVRIELYASTEKAPDFVTDDSCQYVGAFSVDIPPCEEGKKRKLEKKMIFGMTEIVMEVKDLSTGTVMKSSFDYL